MRAITKTLFGVSVALSTLSSAAWAECLEHCNFSQVGIGGAYYDFGGENVSSAGAYLAGEYRFRSISRVQSVFGARLGGGQSRASQLIGVAEKSSFVMQSYYIKLGVNIASVNTPLYVNLFTERDSHDGDAFGGRGLRRDLTLLGAEVEGMLPLGNLRLEYGAGYAWSANGQYALGGKVADMDKGGSVISANVGIAKDINEKYAYYLKLIGKIQNLKAAHFQDGAAAYPHSNNVMAMLEVGIRSF